MISFLLIGWLSVLIPGLQQETPMQAWETFLENLNKAPALEMHFIWNGRIEGTMILQGRSFAIHMDEIHVYCNGVEKWMYNEGFEQWEALPYDTESSDILENPSAFSADCTITSGFLHIGRKGQKGRKPGMDIPAGATRSVICFYAHCHMP